MEGKSFENLGDIKFDDERLMDSINFLENDMLISFLNDDGGPIMK